MHSGWKLPAEVKVVAHVEDDNTIHFVIPKRPPNADELSDEDLEKVAGGIDIFSDIILGTAAVVTLVSAALGIAAVARGS